MKRFLAIALAIMPIVVLLGFLAGMLIGGVATKHNRQFDQAAQSIYRAIKGEVEDDAAPPEHRNDVVVAQVLRKPMIHEISLPGSIEASALVTLSAEMAGRVVAIPLTEGNRLDDVAQPVVELNADDLRAQLVEAEATRNLALREFERIRTLVDQRVAEQSQLEARQAQLQQAEARVQIIEANLAKSVIHSPIAGILDRVYVEVGEYVVPGQRVATVIQEYPLKAVVQIPENRVPFIPLGTQARMSHTVMDGVSATGQFTYLGHAAAGVARTYRAEVTLDNPSSDWKPGMFARLRVPLQTRGDLGQAIPVPIFAVIPAEGRQTVFVEKNGVVYERDVILGTISGNLVNIESGLNPGDMLVIDGQRQLGDRQRVNPYVMAVRISIELPGMDASAIRQGFAETIRDWLGNIDGIDGLRRVYGAVEDGRAAVALIFDIDVADPKPIVERLQAEAGATLRALPAVAASPVIEVTPLPLAFDAIELAPDDSITLRDFEQLGRSLAGSLGQAARIDQVGTRSHPVLAVYPAAGQTTGALAAAIRQNLNGEAEQNVRLTEARSPRLLTGQTAPEAAMATVQLTEGPAVLEPGH